MYTERLQAISSPWADWIHELDSSVMLGETGVSSNIKLDITRGRHFQLLAMFVCCCQCLPETTTPTAPKLELFVSRAAPPTNVFKSEVTGVLASLDRLVRDPALNEGFSSFSARVAPVEFVFIGACFSQRILSSLSRIWLMSGVLLYVLKSLDDDNVKAHAIYRLRRRVRKQFPGNIKMNTRLATFCWAEISDVADGISAVDVPIQAVESRANKTGRKRGRPPVADKTFVTSAIVKKPRERKAGASP